MIKNRLYLRFNFFRALSSVGLEHLVYTEGVGGSNPSAPTLLTSTFGLKNIKNESSSNRFIKGYWI